MQLQVLTMTQLPRLRCWSSKQKFRMLSSAVCCRHGTHQSQCEKRNKGKRGQLGIKACHCFSRNTILNLGYIYHKCSLMSPKVFRPSISSWPNKSLLAQNAVPSRCESAQTAVTRGSVPLNTSPWGRNLGNAETFH